MVQLDFRAIALKKKKEWKSVESVKWLLRASFTTISLLICC